jgi:sigma-54 dependent transcriptional regulator, acetoin dehydrogenase operon transcriptional activator AcoR
MVRSNRTQHADKIFSFVSGNGLESEAVVEQPILRSWERSLQDYRIDPSRPNRVRVLTASELRDYSQPLENFLRIAKAGIDRLHRQVCELGYSALLCDANGVTVDWRGDQRRAREWKEAGLYLGSVWTECHEGTCGVGTGLIEKRPITIHHGEHFRALNSHLTCSSAPIFDPFGNSLAIVDVSALHSPDGKESQHLALQLVMETAHIIESAYFLRKFEDHWVLKISRMRELAEVNSEFLLALDGQGVILAADRVSHREFEQEAGGPLVGRQIWELFDVNLEQLMVQAGQSNLVFPLRTSRRGRQYFVALRCPQAISISPVARDVPRVSPATVPKPGTILELDYLAGADPGLQDAVVRMKRVMNKNIPILLNGETGTGKEMFARAIHHASRRSQKPFIAVNCAAIPESLIESELFGYKEGAFTGARSKGMRGKILQSDGGTLFLDEIGDMPASLQPRLLRVLAEKEVTPLGGDTPIPVDLQVICATHRGIQDMVASGEFREDLYYRLNGVSFELPPLRRRADIANLIRQALTIEAAEEDGAAGLDQAAMAILVAYPWPGNVRQLRNVLRYALAVCEQGVIQVVDLPEEVRCGATPGLPDVSASTPRIRPEAVDADRPAIGACHTMEEAERSVILKALVNQRWQVTPAAREIGISRATLYRKMEKFNIIPPNKR